MKRRSLLGALLGLPAGAALGAVVPEEIEAPSLVLKRATATPEARALMDKIVIRASGAWTPVDPPMRVNDLYLAVNDAGMHRWMRASRAP